MINKLANLWDTKRWLFWILLPITLIAVGIKYYLEFNAMKSEKEFKEAVERDNKLKAEQDEANKQANNKKNESDKIEEKIKERNEEDIDENWHLNE